MKPGDFADFEVLKQILKDLDNLWNSHRYEEYNRTIEKIEQQLPGFKIYRSTLMEERHGLFLKKEETILDVEDLTTDYLEEGNG